MFANGRDPYFPPWRDTVQLNAFSQQLRAATAGTLASIGYQADGVRCDMAMLLLSDVFAKTWTERAGAAPAEEFWTQVIPQVRQRHPDMLFVAEAYWDLESTLQQQGFDHCYDKRLYDRILHEDAESIRAHLRADTGYQRRLLRFCENHDEPRAAATMPADKERAAAVAIATLPGATLWHEGQFEGRRIRPPVFLTRRPPEPTDENLRSFHHHLLAAIHAAGMRAGQWQLLDATGWPDNPTHHNLLAWCWTHGDSRHVIAVNFSDTPAQGRLPLPWPELHDRPWQLAELLTDTSYEHSGDELTHPGLFLALDPWHWHLLSLHPAADR